MLWLAQDLQSGLVWDFRTENRHATGMELESTIHLQQMELAGIPGSQGQ